MPFFWPRVYGIETLGIFSTSVVFQAMYKKDFISKYQMTWKSQPNFRDHVREKLPDISYFKVFLSWLALKHFENVGKRQGIFEWGLLHVITRRIGEMMYETSFTKLHSQKKEMQLFNEFSLFYMYSNFWVLQENHEQILNSFFAHCYQDHWRNEMHYKVHLSTLFPKRNATFDGAFLLGLSVSVVVSCHTMHWRGSSPQTRFISRWNGP